MAYIWDAAVILVLLVCVIRAYSVGFLASAARLAGVVFASLVAVYAARLGCVMLYEQLIQEPVNDYLMHSMQSSASVEEFSAEIMDVLDKMPLPLLSLLGFGENATEEMVAEFKQRISTSISEGILYIEETIIRPPVEGVFQLLIFILVFAVLMFLVGLLVRALREVRHLPVIGPLNALTGALLGAAEGVLLCVLLAFITNILITFTMGRLSWANEELIAQTSIFKHFFEYNFLVRI